jgi:uridylate kinase
VDGVYDKDPRKYADAVRYDTVTISEVVAKKLDVIDHTASVMCEDNGMPLAVFDLRIENGIRDALNGVIHGTRVTAG